MNNTQIQSLRDLPIEEVAQRLGLEINRHKALCPFHNDHHASLTFNLRKNTYRCFACGAHGDTIDLVRHLLYKDFREACLYLSNGSIEPIPALLPSPPGEGQGVRPAPPFDAARYAPFFQHPHLSPEARHFLFEVRRLDPRVIRWCRLTSWQDRQGTHWLQIPYFDPDGHLIGIQNRNLDFLPSPSHQAPLSHSLPQPLSDSATQPPTPSATQPLSDSATHTATQQLSDSATPTSPRFRFPQGSRCTIYNLPVLRLLHEAEPLWIAEGASDCWALLSAGHKAIAIPSATLLKPQDLQPLLTLHSQLSTPFHMAPDQDLPGERLFLRLQALLPNLTRHHLPPTCKDYSDYYLKQVER